MKGNRESLTGIKIIHVFNTHVKTKMKEGDSHVLRFSKDKEGMAEVRTGIWVIHKSYF